MAKRIDTVFTADPNAGNDPSKTASIAVDFGTSTEEAYSLEQISSVVANRLGISENLPDQATFSARFPDNSLIATVDPIQTAYEYYVINTTGATPTSGGTTGALALTAADWDSHTYYLFISDDDSTYVQVEPATDDQNNDGLDPPGLILQASDTIGPVISAFTVNDTTYAYSITATDSQSGLRSTDTYEIRDQTDGALLFGPTTSATGTVPLIARADPYQIICRVFDGHNNFTDFSPPVSITVSSGDAGTMGFSTDSFSGDEDTTPLAVTFTRTDGTVTGTIDVYTIDDTAIGGTNFTAITSGSPTTVTWTGTDNNDKTVNLTVSDQSESVNNQLFMVVAYGSETGSDAAIDIESASIILNGSGASGVVGFQSKGAAPYDITMEGENTNVTITASVKSGQESDTIIKVVALGKDSGDASLDGSIANDYGAKDSLDIEAPYAQIELAPSAALIGQASDGKIRVSHRQQRASSVNIDENFTLMRPVLSVGADGTGVGGAGFRLVTLYDNQDMGTTNSGEKVFFEGTGTALDNITGYAVTDGTSAGKTFDIPTSGSAAYTATSRATAGYAFGEATGLGPYNALNADGARIWNSTNSAAAQRTLYIDDETVPWIFRMYARSRFYRKGDKFVFAADADAFDPNIPESGTSTYGADDDFGPWESTYSDTGGGAPIDNDENTTRLPYPLPTATATVSSYIPETDSATNIVTSIITRLTYDNMTNLQWNTYELTGPSGSVIAGAVISSDNVIQFNPTQPLTENTLYTITWELRITDTDGDVKKSTGSRTFTTVDNTDSVWSQDFEAFAATVTLPHTCTEANMQTLYGATTPSPEHAANCTVMADPTGSGRGAVASVIHYKGMIGIGATAAPGYEPPIPSGFQAMKITGDMSEVWVAYDVYIPADFIFPRSIKGVQLLSTPFVAYNANTSPELLGTQLGCAFGGFKGSTPTEFNPNPDSLADGVFSVNTVYGAGISSPKVWQGVLDDPASAPSSSSALDPTRAYATFQKGQWNRVVGHVKNNTLGVANGEVHAYLNGVLVVQKTAQTFISSTVGDSTLKWERHLMIPWYGGADVTNACPQTQSLIFDNHIVSANPLI